MTLENSEVLRGICHFFFETGSEGGHWAFQDGNFITKNVTQPYCRKCGKFLGPQKYKNLEVEKVVPLTKEVLAGKEPPECPEGKHERDISNSWSEKGTHILKDGDRLTIYSPKNPSKVVWSGTISLHQHRLFTKKAFGLWIHADQKGIKRNTWAKYFFKEYPAELIPARRKP